MNSFTVIILCFGTVLISGIPDARPKRAENEERWQIFHNAAHSGNVEKIEELLRNGTDINIRDQGGRTPIFSAARNGRHIIVELLIKNGADVNLKNDKGQCPIYTATFEGHERVVEILIKNGADVNIRENDGWAPINVAAHKDYEQIAELLLKNGANVNNQNNRGQTPLFTATNFGRHRLVQTLLNHGANVNLQINNGQTPLYCAVFEGFEDIVAVLVQNGADVNIQEQNGWAPLHAAVQIGREKIVEFLLRNGADANLKNKNNDTPMDLAARKGNGKIIELLKTVRRIRPSEKACEVYSQLPINRVIGGELADAREFPWMAARGYIEVNNNYTVNFDCGGTIISELFIVTAAHCVKSSRRPVLVRLGKITLFDDDRNAVNRLIKDIIRHPFYSIRTKKNDIALIEVAKSITFSVDIVPACLQTDTKDLDSNIKLTVSGWGSVDADRLNRTNVLHKTDLETVPLSECNKTLLELNKRLDQAAFRNGLIEGQYCAYDSKENSDSCQGDSGGPLQYFRNNENSSLANIVGIVSFGLSCGAQLPSIYTRVSFYLDWIEAIVWPNPIDFNIGIDRF